MRSMLTQRPLVLPAACTRVPELPIATPKAAWALVGYGAAVAAEAALGAELTRSQQLTQEAHVQIDRTNGFVAKPSAAGMDPVGGVRGIPPRGWPV